MFASLSVKEVSALFTVDERRLWKEVENGILASPDGPRFDFPSVVYLLVVSRFGFDLGVADRRRLFEIVRGALTSALPRPQSVAISPVADLKLGSVADQAEQLVDRFRTWASRLSENDSVLAGEPTFPNSRLSVRRIGGMLARGASSGEVLEDYPYLNEQDLEFALMYTKAYPRRGRPRDSQAPSR